MDWEEIRTRAGQELHRRGDLLRHRLGWKAEAIRLRQTAEPAGRFFFTAKEAATRVELLRQHLPEQAAAIVREADEICQHRFRVLGYEGLIYGASETGEIDWHLDPVHGKRAPLDPWFKIPFLDFAVVGDHKVIWEVNRHQHLVTLAKAWLLTKDAKYVRELMAQWRSWQKANPYPLGINWGSTLEVAFRSLSWIWIERLLAGNAAKEPASAEHATPGPETASIEEFRAELLPALAFHGRYIERYLSTYFSPNTHLLGEAVAMFFLGTLYPQMPHAARWKSEGWRIVLHEATRQVRPDGVYFEQSLYYHVYALDFFLYARLLAAANEVDVPAAYDGVLNRMLDVVEALAQAGPAEGFGDDDGGRLFDPRRDHTEHMTDPLAIGALAYGRDDLSAARLTEESIWLFGEHAVEKLGQPNAARGLASGGGSCALADGGLYVLSASEPLRQTMMIDAGPQGVGRCGHGHADALSMRLTMGGARWLVDAGSGVYISDDPADRNSFRGTAAHNTLRVDGADQAVAGEPFSWTDIPTARVDNWAVGKSFTYFAGSHNGYTRLADPVTHRRSVLCVEGGIWMVRDVALGKAEHDLELNWHFASDVSVEEWGAGEFVATRSSATSAALRMLLPADTAWKTSIAGGLISPAYGRYEAAQVVRSEARAKLPAEISTILVADARMEQRCSPARLVAAQGTSVQAYELHDRGETYGFFFALENRTWSLGPWSSDAEMLYCRIADDKLAQLIMIGGSRVSWQGQPLVETSGATKFAEWRKADGMRNPVDCFLTTELLDELARGSKTLSIVASATSSYVEKH